MLTIVEPTTTAGDGITRPRLCRLSDDEFYYVKGRRLTPQGLVNELVCGHLGLALGLPIPEFSLTSIPKFPDGTAFADLRDDMGFGSLFASKRVSSLMELDLSQATKVPETLRRNIAAFDYWVGNGDRTLTEFGGNPNLFWDLSSDSLVVLDHNLAFDADLNTDDLVQTHVFRVDLTAIFGDAGLCQKYSDLFSDILATWDEIISRVPEDWMYSDEQMTIDAKLDFTGMRQHLERLLNANGWGA
jgi:hypothetical protein